MKARIDKFLLLIGILMIWAFLMIGPSFNIIMEQHRLPTADEFMFYILFATILPPIFIAFSALAFVVFAFLKAFISRETL